MAPDLITLPHKWSSTYFFSMKADFCVVNGDGDIYIRGNLEGVSM